MSFLEAAGMVLGLVWASELVLLAVTYWLVNREPKPKPVRKPARPAGVRMPVSLRGTP